MLATLRFFLLFMVPFLLMACHGGTTSTKTKREADQVVDQINSVKESLSKIHQPDSLALEAEMQSLKLMNKLPDSVLAPFFQEVGMMFYGLSAYDDAYDYFEKSKFHYQQANQPLKAIRMISNQAVLQELRGNYKEAIDMYLDAANYFSDARDFRALALVYTNIAVVYQEMGMADKSLEYNKMGLKIKNEEHDSLGMASNLNNIGVLYDEYFQHTDSALYYYQKAVDLYHKFHASERLAFALNNVGRMHLEMNQQSLAKKELARAYALMDSLNNAHGRAKVLRNQGELYFSQLNNQQAIKAFNQSMKLFEELGDKKSVVEVSELLSKVYLAAGNYAKAAQYLKLQSQVKDELMSAESKSIIAEMETRFQVREKNKTIALLELQDEINHRKITAQLWGLGLLLVIFALLLALFYFYISRSKLKQKQLRLELQNYLLEIRDMKTAISQTPAESADENIGPDFEEYDLTEREKEVLQMIAKGYKNTDIADKLFVSENTIKTHIKHIYVKLDVKNRVEALKRVKLVQ